MRTGEGDGGDVSLRLTETRALLSPSPSPHQKRRTFDLLLVDGEERETRERRESV